MSVYVQQHVDEKHNNTLMITTVVNNNSDYNNKNPTNNSIEFNDQIYFSRPDEILRFKLSDSPNKKDYTCVKCNKLLYKPIETACCGKLMCIHCKKSSCDTCNLDTPLEYHHSTRAELDVLNLDAKCPFENCIVVASLKSIIYNHIPNCPYELIICGECNMKLFRTNEIVHREQECTRQYKCHHQHWSGCKFIGTNLELSKHVQEYEYHCNLAITYVDNLITVTENSIDSYKSGVANLSEQNKVLREENKKLQDQLFRVSIKCKEIEHELEQFKTNQNIKKKK